MEDIFYRQMPHSLEAEQSVLGSMLIDANCVKDVMEQLRPDDFYLKQNREIFETIYSMFVYSKPIDGVTVAGPLWDCSASLVSGCKDFASERNESLLSNCRAPLNLLQS